VKDGRTNFSELQAALAVGRQRDMVFYAFDLLYLDGLPQIERKRVLKQLSDETGLGAPILLGEHMDLMSKSYLRVPNPWARASSAKPPRSGSGSHSSK